MPSIVPPRHAIPREHIWDVDSVFANAAAWSAEFDALISELPSLARFRGHLADSAPILAHGAASEQIGIRAGNVSDMRRYAVIGL